MVNVSTLAQVHCAATQSTSAKLSMRRQRTQLGWEVIDHGPKSEAGKSTVALDAGTVTALRAHQREQVAERLAWGPAWVDSGKVFTGVRGSRDIQPRSTTSSTKSWPRPACPRCGCTICGAVPHRSCWLAE